MAEEEAPAQALSAADRVEAFVRHYPLLCLYVLFPLVLVVSAPVTCAFAGGGDRCLSLTNLSGLAYVAWLAYLATHGLPAPTPHGA